MHYFDRTNKFSNRLIIMSILSFIISILALFKNSENPIAFAIWFTISIVCILICIALKCIVKDAKEELDIIKKVYGEYRNGK